MKNMNTKAKKLEQTSLSKSLNGSNRWSKPNVSGYAIEILNVFAPCKAISHFFITYSYTPRTLRACCSQSKFRILKIRESSARAIFLYNWSPNISRSADAQCVA